MADGLVLHASEIDFERRVLEASVERAVLVERGEDGVDPGEQRPVLGRGIGRRHVAVLGVLVEVEEHLDPA